MAHPISPISPIALHCFQRGNKYPYDAGSLAESFESMNTPVDWTVRAARGILADLCDRRGIKHGLQSVDEPDTRHGIVVALAEIIQVAHILKDAK